MKRSLKLLTLFLFIISITLGACNYNLLRYGVSQGYGQLRIVLKAKPVKKILQDPQFPDSLKSKLLLIQEIRRFAIDSLGVNDSKNYTTVYDQHGKPVLWVITACAPYEFKPKEWHFPFIGDVPYKGFFNYESAEKERKQLFNEGYDTEIGTVGGWSTLGWFRDPILSNMLQESEGSIAELIIHELTHATLYVKDSTDYNENLASFIGEKGAIRFLTFKYGKSSPEMKEYIEDMADENTYTAYILGASKNLDRLYKGFSAAMPDSLKKNLKKEKIRDIRKNIANVAFNDTTHYYRRIRRVNLNNAYIMSFKRYEGKHDDFENRFEKISGSDLRKFLAYMKKKYGK